VLLLPGLLCDGAVFAGQLDALATRHECLLGDYLGRDSLPGMAEAVLARAPPRFVLIAHSMGGRVALEIVRRAAARVVALALLDSGYQGRATGAVGEQEAREREALLALARTEGMHRMGRVWLPPMVHPARLNDAALTGAILAMVERCPYEVFAAQVRALLARPDATEVLRSIRCPTLIACGREDVWSPLARHEAMAALVPGSRLEVIEACGHMAPMERPTEVSSLLMRWLGSL